MNSLQGYLLSPPSPAPEIFYLILTKFREFWEKLCDFEKYHEI